MTEAPSRASGRSWTGLALTPVRAWSGASQVRRVALYTDVSLYLLMWLLPPLIYSNLRSVPTGVLVWLIGATVLHLLAATVVMRATLRLYPADGPLDRRHLVVLALTTVSVLAVAVASWSDPETRVLIFVVAATVVTFAIAPVLSGARSVIWALGATAFGAVVLGEWAASPFLVLGTVTVVYGCRISLWLREIVVELDRARDAQSALAVAEERLRFSRDLHDTLGRNLSAIAVTSELAAELSKRGDQRAPEQMLSVRELAHESLREVRVLVHGYRTADFDAEVTGARSLLESAGIRCDVDAPPGASVLSAEHRDLAAWVVREAVTNVLRHSRAHSCVIRLEGTTLTIVNDGAIGDTASDGSGLTGLRERLAVGGATLSTRRNGSTFEVSAEFGGKEAHA